MIQTNKIYWADKVGIISATLCIVHCLAAPMLLLMGIGALHNPVVSLLFILVAFWSIYKATKGKLFNNVSVFLWVAFIGFVISILLEGQAAIFEYAMFLFSIFIILGHFYNIRKCLKS